MLEAVHFVALMQMKHPGFQKLATAAQKQHCFEDLHVLLVDSEM